MDLLTVDFLATALCLLLAAVFFAPAAGFDWLADDFILVLLVAAGLLDLAGAGLRVVLLAVFFTVVVFLLV